MVFSCPVDELLLLRIVHVERNEWGFNRLLTVEVSVNGLFNKESKSVFLDLMAQGYGHNICFFNDIDICLNKCLEEILGCGYLDKAKSG